MPGSGPESGGSRLQSTSESDAIVLSTLATSSVLGRAVDVTRQLQNFPHAFREGRHAVYRSGEFLGQATRRRTLRSTGPLLDIPTKCPSPYARHEYSLASWKVEWGFFLAYPGNCARLPIFVITPWQSAELPHWCHSFARRRHCVFPKTGRQASYQPRHPRPKSLAKQRGDQHFSSALPPNSC